MADASNNSGEAGGNSGGEGASNPEGAGGNPGGGGGQTSQSGLLGDGFGWNDDRNSGGTGNTSSGVVSMDSYKPAPQELPLGKPPSVTQGCKPTNQSGLLDEPRRDPDSGTA